DFTYTNILTMDNDESYLSVGGTMYADGAMRTINNLYDTHYVTKGIIELKGNLDATTHNSTMTGKNTRFITSGTSKVIFSGEETQKISSPSLYPIHIKNMYPENDQITTDTGFQIGNLCGNMCLEAPTKTIIINEWNDYNVTLKNVDISNSLKISHPSDYLENVTLSADRLTYTHEYYLSELSKPIMSISSESILEKGTQVQFAQIKQGVRIFYSLDGSVPNSTSNEYNGAPIVINEDTEINAIAMREGAISSQISKYIFKIKRYAPVIVIQPTDLSAAVGEMVTFMVEATGDGLQYQWQYSRDNGQNWSDSGMNGANTAILTIVASNEENGQQYRCKIIDSQENQVISSAVKLSLETSGNEINENDEGYYDNTQDHIDDNQNQTGDNQGPVDDNQNQTDDNQGLVDDNQNQTDDSQGPVDDNQNQNDDNQGPVYDNHNQTDDNQDAIDVNQDNYGDINGDGKVNSLDSIYLARALARWPGYSGVDDLMADVN
nr:chitobiase/beta-hexosaminidase C-terminal domain-containing protein [Acetatifactor sp.]